MTFDERSASSDPREDIERSLKNQGVDFRL
jgi:hypothetical protein